MPALYTHPIYLRVPVIKTGEVRIPQPLLALTRNGFKNSAWFTDIDGCELVLCDPGASDQRNIPKLSGAGLHTAVSMLEKGGKIVYITGSMFAHQEARTVAQIRDALREKNRLSLMAGGDLAIYGNRGASCGWYKNDGSLDQDLFDEYIAGHGVSRDFIAEIKARADESIGEFWKYYTADPSRADREFPGYHAEEKPIFQIRDRASDGNVAQVAVLPFPAVWLPRVIDYLGEKLPRAINTALDFTPGGGTTVDVNRKGVSKASAFEHYILRRLKIKVRSGQNPFLPYAGDETGRKLLKDGEKRGGDAFPLRIPGTFLLGFDPDPEEVIKVPGRSFHMGFGPVANGAVRRWVVENWGEQKPAETKLEVPFKGSAEVPIPPTLAAAMSYRFSQTIVGCSGSLITGFQHQKDIRAAKVGPTLQEVIRHLQNDWPFLILSGGDYEYRLKPQLDAIRMLMGHSLANMTSLLAFSNNGALAMGFDQQGEPKPARDIQGILTAHLPPLRTLANRIVQEHARAFPRSFARPKLEERLYQKHTLQMTILPFEPEARAWVQNRFNELLPKTALQEVYSGELSTHSFDIVPTANSKAACLKFARSFFHLPENALIVYFGGHFYSYVDRDTTQTIQGLDMSTLRDPNILPIALNDEQDTVPVHPTIVRGGSGSEALANWLAFMHNPMGHGIIK